jgi:hypothetical protein
VVWTPFWTPDFAGFPRAASRPSSPPARGVLALPGHDHHIDIPGVGHGDDGAKLGITAGGEQAPDGRRMLVDHPGQPGFAEVAIGAEVVEPADNPIDNANHALLALELESEVWIVSKP